LVTSSSVVRSPTLLELGVRPAQLVPGVALLAEIAEHHDTTGQLADSRTCGPTTKLAAAQLLPGLSPLVSIMSSKNIGDF
jgi:hypothetical protein